MQEYLMLKSRAESIADYASVDISGLIPAFIPDEGLIDRDIQRLRSRYGTKISADRVENGDTISISCQSAEAKFCKKSLCLIVGKGLFSRELEAQLLGRETGSFTCTAEGAQVEVTILSIQRTVLPELTDENVAAWGMDGITSLRDMRRYCINKQIDKLLDDSEDAERASAAVWLGVTDGSVLHLDAEEIAWTQAAAEKKLQQLMQMEDETWEEQQMREMVYQMYLTQLCTAVIGQKMCQEAGTLRTTADYEAYLQKRMDAYPDKTEAELRAKYDLQDFMTEEYGDVLAQAIDRYVAGCFQKAMNP